MRDAETLMRNEIIDFIAHKLLIAMEVEEVSLGEKVLSPLGQDYVTALKLLNEFKK